MRTRDDPKTHWYPEAHFGGYTDADQVVVFYTRVRSLIEPSSVVLDVGCGRGGHTDELIPTRRRLRTLKGLSDRLIGLDVDPGASANPFVDEFHVIEQHGTWPVPAGSVDVLVGDYVLEHVEHPEVFFDECRRVLRPGGYLALRTTNSHSYFGLAARALPNRIHAGLVQRMYRSPRGEADVFPVRFRCNTITKIRAALERRNFQHCVYGHQADPAHFGFSPILYRVGVLHQRYAPDRVKPTIFVFAQLLPDGHPRLTPT